MPPEFEPVGDALEPTIAKTAEVMIGFSTKNPGFIQLNIVQISGEPNTVRPGPNGPFIAIEDDTIVEFSLDPNFNWTWSGVPLSFKNNVHSRYYKNATLTDAGKKFKLHASRSGKPRPEIHECTFNVVLEQVGGTHLEIKIDPEIKNPPPPPVKTVAVGETVLL
jgi:hypothetical protein